MTKHVYSFGGNRNEGSAQMRNLLGGKGCNLAEMAGLGIPVPPGFTVTTEVCTLYGQGGKKLPQDVKEQVLEALKWLEGVRGKKLGDATIHIGRNEGGAFMSLMKYVLTNAMISNINTSGGGGVPSDSFAVNFTKIKSEFTQQNADSTKKGTASFGWDLATNKAA